MRFKIYSELILNKYFKLVQLFILNLIQNIKLRIGKIMKLFKNYGIYILLALFIYLMGFVMLHNDLWNPLTTAYGELEDTKKTKLWGELFFSLGSLALTVIILKFLLAMEPFKDSMKDIFTEIFSEQKFLLGVDKESLLNIAKNIHKANKDILFLDKTQDNESVIKLQNYFNTDIEANKEKNYLIIESKYSTTLLASGIEIMHRKIKCKIIKDGRFKLKYLFTSPDNTVELDCATYENTFKNDRFNMVSYNRILKSSIPDDGFTLKDTLSNDKIEEDKAVSICFTKLHTVISEILDIEFSISHPFKLKEKKDIEEYYNTTYRYPHAIRNIVFQIEKYNYEDQDKTPDIAPVLYSDTDNLIQGNYHESIYYKTYSWEIFYSQEECEKVSIKVE